MYLYFGMRHFRPTEYRNSVLFFALLYFPMEFPLFISTVRFEASKFVCNSVLILYPFGTVDGKVTINQLLHAGFGHRDKVTSISIHESATLVYL